ncbi:stressosome-associated protein Prli42 [Paenibacillus senegalensis]|nr:stressosome-associated protein Prli42 [Paenibacillus senegalensis]
MPKNKWWFKLVIYLMLISMLLTSLMFGISYIF